MPAHKAHRKEKTDLLHGVTNACGLHAYISRSAARRGARFQYGQPFRPVRCDTCGLWHNRRLDDQVVRGEATHGELRGTPHTYATDRLLPAHVPVPAAHADYLPDKCGRCAKALYLDEQTARRAATYFAAVFGAPRRVYRQKSCGGWHLTSQDQRTN